MQQADRRSIEAKKPTIMWPSGMLSTSGQLSSSAGVSFRDASHAPGA